MTAQGDGFSPNNPAGSGADADYDGITVPVAARDDYLFKTDDTPGGTAKLVFNGLPAGVYSVTMFEGRTTDANQVAKLWTGATNSAGLAPNVTAPVLARALSTPDLSCPALIVVPPVYVF
jgi:hypothetical protein